MALRGSGSRILRLVLAALAPGAALATFGALRAAPADAHHWRHYHRHVPLCREAIAPTYAARRQAAPADPAFSAIVVDANTGRKLYGVNENAPRHPASITKVMTLYLLFEQLDKGALTLQIADPDLRARRRAGALQARRRGRATAISVDDAIKAIVTRSANDVAVAIAEAIGHDESAFAEMMTRKAHALGMSRTLYRNASGLPNDEQITTARDLTILARATEERFPALLPLFLDPRIRIRRRGHRQPQSPARPRRRRRRHQDRLHPRLRLQPADLGASRRALAGRGRHGRAHGGRARPHHGSS